MNDQEIPSYLKSLKESKIRLDLIPFEKLLARLDNPHQAYPSILVGGTNGKGSIASMIAAILTHAGFRVGLYTSPHLVDFRERICVDGTMISLQEASTYFSQVRKNGESSETYFECLTAAAFLHFKARQVDWAVLEVGMGGRLDATNTVMPFLSVIANISLEHRNYLGHTLREIATEKAGIIKKKGICLTAATQKTVLDVFRAQCDRHQARLLQLGKDFKIKIRGNNSFDFASPELQVKGLKVALPGLHQIRNAALALASIAEIRKHGYTISEQDIFNSMANVRWPGRLETVRQNPRVILDGAHNPAAISALCQALPRLYSWRRLLVVFGALRDKQYGIMVKKLYALADQMILTMPDTERAASPEEFLPHVAGLPGKATIIRSPVDAFKTALSSADVHDLICVTGSLYLLGAIKEYLDTKRDGVLISAS